MSPGKVPRPGVRGGRRVRPVQGGSVGVTNSSAAEAAGNRSRALESVTCPDGRWLSVEIEVARRLLLEPQPVVLRRLLQEVRRLLEHVLALGRRLGGGRVLDRRAGRRTTGLASSGSTAGSARPRASPRGGVARLGLAARARARRTAVVGRLRRGLGRSRGLGVARRTAAAPRRARPRRAAPANSPRCGGPSASCSRRATSSASAPRRRLSSRCSRMASSSNPICCLKPTPL